MKKIFLLSIIPVFLILSSCKKETPEGNIYHKQINISITANETVPSIGLYGDSVLYVNNEKFIVQTYSNTFRIGMGDFSSNVEFGKTGQNLKIFNLNEEINQLAVSSWSYSGASGDLITPGSGDKYVAFRIKPDENIDKSYYGWMKLNFASNAKTITIIEYAYNQNVNESIKVGQK